MKNLADLSALLSGSPEKKKPKRSEKRSRARSVRPNDPHSKTPKKKGSRPDSSQKYSKKRVNTSSGLLGKLKSKLNSRGKDRLSQDNMLLKLENSNLKEEVQRLRSRCGTQDLRFPTGKLSSSVKMLIKDLRSQLHNKENEISQLKKNMKSTVVSELEIEIQAYIDECTRLRHHLEEVLRKKESPEHSVYHSESFKDQLRFAKEEVSHWKQKYKDIEKKNIVLESKVKEILADGKSALFKSTTSKLKETKTSLKALLGDRVKNGEIKQTDLSTFFDVSKHIIEDLALSITGNAKRQIPIEGFDDWLARYECQPTNRENHIFEEVADYFAHLSCTFQLQKVPRSQIVNALFGDLSPSSKLSVDFVTEKLQKSPLKLSVEELIKFSTFLVERNASLKDVADLIFKHTSEWEVFSKQDEFEFDRQLGDLIPNNFKQLENTCKLHDSNGSGTVSKQDFRKATSKLNFSESLISYVSLMHYAQTRELDMIPYANLIATYQEDEEEQAKIVRGHLTVIAEKLNQKNKSARQAFKTDLYGLIYPKEFVEGLKSIGIQSLDQQTVILILEALQYEEEENLCVYMDEFEDILEHYGVPVGSSGHNSVIVKDSAGDSPRSV